MSESAARADASQFERLEALVRTLVDRHRALALEREQLHARLTQKDARVKVLDTQLVQLNQTRRDAAKRIDELVAQLDHVQAEVERRLSGNAVKE